MSLKAHILASYGASVQQKTNLLKESKKKVAKSKNQFIFLQRCVRHRLIPKSLRTKDPIKTTRSRAIAKKYQFELLMSVKNDAKRRYFKNVTDTTEIQEELRGILSPEDMEIIERVTEKSREEMFKRSKRILIKKFEILGRKRNPNNQCTEEETHSLVKDPVLNLDTSDTPQAQKELLKLGPKFVPTTTKIPYMDLVTTTEASALRLEFEKKDKEAQVLRQDVLRVLKMAKPIEDNLTREQRTAIKEIKEDPTIRIYPFDKGTGLVRIKNEDAVRKIREQIGETQIVERDPTDTFVTEIQRKLSSLNKKGRFDSKEYEKMYPSDAVPPRMYGTIKAHKPEKNFPMRIVVSTVGSPAYGISSFLVNLIQPTLDKNKTRLKNSKSFVEQAKTWTIGPGETQVSYDVVNLYPKVPLKEATEVAIDLLREDPSLKSRTKLKLPEIKEMVELCLSRCYFIWNEEIHVLNNSGPIGLSIMVVMAEAFLQTLEAKALNDALHKQPSVAPLSFVRYVDDSHSRFENEEFPEQFLEILNAQHPSIQYTMDRESTDKSLQFLDLMTTNNGEGRYEFKIYRKEAITNVQIKTNSSHDPKVLRGVFKGFVYRALALCSAKYVDEEIEFLIKVFEENGYKKEELRKLVSEVKDKHGPAPTRKNDEETEELGSTITLPWIPGVSPKLKKAYKKAGYRVTFKSGKNLGSILTANNKMKLPKNSYPGVYKIPCSCGQTPYRGETKKKISTRIKEHKEYIRKNQPKKSGIALHASTCDGEVLFEEAETEAVQPNKFLRKVREALEIQKHDCHTSYGGMNPDKGQYVTTKFWIPLMKYLKKSTM